MNTKKINLKITRQQINKFAIKVIKNRKFLFLFMIGVAMLFSFNFLYRKIYVGIVYMQYPSSTNSVNMQKESAALEEIMQEMEKREENLAHIKDEEYVDPFNFKKEEAENTEFLEQDDWDDAG
ncbi:MAG: hypothetical protein WC178_03965 [Candidatus Paceibacterota bacterium]